MAWSISQNGSKMGISPIKPAAIASRLLNLVYPRSCFYCKTSLQNQPETASWQGFFCASCWSEVKRSEGATCPRCAEPFPSQVTLTHSPQHLCGDCRKSPPAFSRAITPYSYETTLAKGILLLKYQQKTRLVSCFVDLLLDDLRSLAFDQVLAIPLHSRRLQSREFNQSLLLAKGLAEQLNRPLLIDVMRRTKETLPQVGLSLKDRKKNVHRAFQVTKPERVIGQRLLLVDDVYTTGATLREGAKVLTKAGAKEVFVTAIARMALH